MTKPDFVTGQVFELLMASTYAGLQTRIMSQRYVIECYAWYIQLPVDPVCDIFH